jgi:2-polyprenyl-3-methyl-5-hydroxy-6-metoxy-1,4-benzoquinol methylase
MNTPLRELTVSISQDCRILQDSSLTYHDGGEPAVLNILQSSKDLSSTSDELRSQASNWPEEYHFDPARMHVLRPLNLHPDSNVLEIGAGCGAITRLLGERCGLVDALEPMADRAQCARERTRDLDNVEVFVGLLEDVPAQPTYDVIVIMGVLEYVGNGSLDDSIYQEFLEKAALLLIPGGSLILGIENSLGVKYLCGAPEDHSNRAFESVEGYPTQSVARTFSRHQLETFFEKAGLSSSTLGLFPDYKLTRLLFSDELLKVAPDLAVAIPDFPSPDWISGGPRVAREGQVWKNLVASGLGNHTANSLLVLGHKGPGNSPLWTPDLLAAYYPSPGRKMSLSNETLIHADGGSMTFTRQRLRQVEETDIFMVNSEAVRQVDGTLLLTAMTEAESEFELVSLFERWLAALDTEISNGNQQLIDALPHNAVLTPSGDVVFVDSKWTHPRMDRSALLQRCAFVTSFHFSEWSQPFFIKSQTQRELTIYVGSLLGLSASTKWIEHAVEQEAEFQAVVHAPTLLHPDFESLKTFYRSHFLHCLQLPVHDHTIVSTLFQREEILFQREEITDLKARIELNTQLASEEITTLEGRVVLTEQQRDLLQQEVDSLKQSRTFRYTAVPRNIFRGWKNFRS